MDDHELLLRHQLAIEKIRKISQDLLILIAILQGQLTEQEITEYQRRGGFVSTQEGKK